MRSRIIDAWNALRGKAQRTPDRYYESTVTTADLSQHVRGRSREQREAHELAKIATEWVGFCANINAQACSSIPLRLYRRAGSGPKAVKDWDGRVRRVNVRPLTRKQQRWQHEYAGVGAKAVSYAEGAGDVEEITDHPILDVLRRPNPIQSGHEFDYQLFHSMEITGKAFRHKVVGPDGVPVMFFFMSPLWTKIVPDRDGLIGAFVYGRDGTIEATFQRDEVDYFRHTPSLDNPYDGRGPLHDVGMSQAIWLAAHRGEAAWWENSARPDMLVQVDPAKLGPGAMWTEDNSKALQARINSALRGPDKRGRFLVVTASEIKPLQFTPKDMEYLAGKTDLKQTILARYGVPESFATLNDANLASSITGHRQYQENTILPRVTRRADDETERLIPLFGAEPGEMWFGYDNPVRSDEEQTANRMVSLVGAGLFTINEARAELDYDPVEGGDLPRINGVPLDRVGQPTAPAFSGFGPLTFGRQERPALPPGEEDGNGNGDDRGSEDQRGEADAAKSGGAVGRSGLAGGSKGGQSPKAEATQAEAVTPERDNQRGDAASGGVRAAVATKDDRAEPAFDRVVSRALRALLQRVSVGEDGDVTFPEDAADTLAEALRPHWQQAYVNGRVNNGVVPGDGFDVLPEDAIRFIDEQVAKLAQTVADEERRMVLTFVRNGLEQGQSVAEMTRAIREGTGDTGARAERIARTEEATATTEGNLSAWRQAGSVRKRWNLSPNSCSFCRALAARYNEAIELDKPYAEVGETIVDAEGVSHPITYRTISGPPAHPHCTCALEPVLE